jgi:hypothetical protein
MECRELQDSASQSTETISVERWLGGIGEGGDDDGLGYGRGGKSSED